MYKKIVPVALLIAGMLVSGGGRAQVYSCRFHYAEKAVTDYSSLLSAGNVKQKRQESLRHAGTMHATALNDSVLHIVMKTDSFSTTMAGVDMPSTLQFDAYTDSNNRVYKVAAAGSNKVFFSVLQLWLGEIHFKLPAPGAAVEARPDGDLSVVYVQSPNDGNAVAFKKDNAAYLVKAGSKQVVKLNAYKWDASFDRQTSWVQEVRFYEDKQQVMGRKVLACIQRELAITGITGDLLVSPDTTVYHAMYLYPRLTEKERRERLAISLLGKETTATISGRLQQAETMPNEQQFRLKSIIRSLIIVDSTAVNTLLQLPAAKQGNSVAFNIIENAIIESRTAAGDAYTRQAFEKNENNYERLKELLIKISLAETFTNGTGRQLLALLHKDIDADTRSMVSLALSNYALLVRDDDRFYNEIAESLLRPYKNAISDTLQYIYLVGNAGIEAETARLVQIATSSAYQNDAIFALRNIRNPTANAAIHNYLLGYRGNENVFGSLLASREMPPGFWTDLEKNIMTADAGKDSTALPAIRYVLDNAWQRNLNVKKLLAHKFRMEAYRQEVDDFIRQSSLCN